MAGTGQHQGDKFVVPGLCGADVEVHQAVNQGGERYITHIVQTWYEANKNKGIMFRMQDWVESGKTESTGSSSIKQAYQNILISGSAGDVHALGCWAKGDSVPLTSGTSRRFGIVLRF